MLYIVATPIGNLKDITLRALEILKSVDLILCEDTRVSKKLLNAYEINTPLLSYHQHSKLNKIDLILDKLKQGENLALISDAGTPGISDPGNILVEKALENNISVEPIPGPSAVLAAASVSGFPTDKFVFLGFIPKKKGKNKFFKKIESEKLTVIFYESVHRIIKTLEQMAEVMTERQIFVCRELTKMFEEKYRGTPAEVLVQMKGKTPKGEFVVIVRGLGKNDD